MSSFTKKFCADVPRFESIDKMLYSYGPVKGAGPGGTLSIIILTLRSGCSFVKAVNVTLVFVVNISAYQTLKSTLLSNVIGEGPEPTAGHCPLVEKELTFTQPRALTTLPLECVVTPVVTRISTQ